MFSRLSKHRGKGGSQKDKRASSSSSGSSISSFSVDEAALSSPISGIYQKAGLDSPWMEEFTHQNMNPPFSFAHDVESSGNSYTDSVEYASESKQSWTSSKHSWTSSSIPEEEAYTALTVLPDYDEAEEQFLEDYDDYFEHLQVDNIRKEQYGKLEMQRIAYLDYASFALFSKFQVEEHMRILQEEGPCLGSVSLSNASTSHLRSYVLETEDHLLRIFRTNKNDYSVIFTTGFVSGCRLFGDIYPFQKGSYLLACQDNHEALKHILSTAVQHGGKVTLAPIRQSDLSLHTNELTRILKKQGWYGGGTGLFIYPAQSCLSGVCHSLNWIAEAQQYGWQILLDASTYLPTGLLDLSVYNPEFVLGSFHHMLGYPSGMGFVLVRRQKFSVQHIRDGLKLVSSLDDKKDFHIVSEDDSINLLSFAALSFGLQHLQNVGLVPIQKRVQSLITWLLQVLVSLRHKTNDKLLIEVYGPRTHKKRSNILTFNVIDSTGNYFPANLVQKLAKRNNIIIGAGQFNNPGLIKLLSEPADRMENTTGYKNKKASNFSAVRVSLGPMSNFRDVYRLAQFISRFREEDYASTEAMGFIEESH